jgi:signal transduction histidine kinase
MRWLQLWLVELLIAQFLRPSRGWMVAVLSLALWLATGAGALAGDVAGNGKETARKVTDDDSPTNGLGSWIWAAKTFDRQTCLFWRSFEIPPQSPAVHARLVMTVDNEYTLFLDGRELGRGVEWRELFDYDVSRLMTPGTHVLAVKAYNASSFAGMLFGLRVDFADGRVIEVKSDENWRIVSEGTRGWEKSKRALAAWPRATIIAPMGVDPWKDCPENVNTMPTLEPIKVLFWQTGWFQISLLTLSVLAILISLRLVAQQALHRKERWLLQQERARIARDIHDDLGSKMTALVLQGEVMQSELPANSATRVKLEKLCEAARGILSTMDEILWAVNPRKDAFRDFITYVCSYAQEFLKSKGIQCLFDIDPTVSEVVLNLPLKRTLLMVIKETLNNTVKHSEATELVLSIKWQAQYLVVVILDNGKGFDKAASKSDRNGLFNMNQRMSELGGACLITSEPGKGCRTEFNVPWKQSRWQAWRWNRSWEQYAQQVNKPSQLHSDELSSNHDSANC